MYKRVLIANRADCAARLIDGVHALGIEAVLAVGTNDRLSLPESKADEIIVTGADRDAFVHAENLIEAAHQRHCEALLPGWGFLSETAIFAQQCRLSGIHFVGPKTSQLALFGDKLETLKKLAPPLGLPQHYLCCDDPQFTDKLAQASQQNWVLKNRMGGGGKGIYLCGSAANLVQQLHDLTQTNSLNAYYAEPLVSGRHIEFQIFGDGSGKARVLGVRDCSDQKRCQKQREFHVAFNSEAWIRPFVARIEAAFASLGYKSWGTLETIVAADGQIHLLEVNPRLQVEHGVTEMATGIDLVRAALMLECGHSLDEALFTSEPIDTEHVEVEENRYFAERPGPAPLPVFDGYDWPHSPYDSDQDVRIETGYMPNEVVTGAFDGMIARIIRRRWI